MDSFFRLNNFVGGTGHWAGSISRQESNSMAVQKLSQLWQLSAIWKWGFLLFTDDTTDCFATVQRILCPTE